MPHTSSHSMSVTSYEAAIHRNDACNFGIASDADINVQRRGLSAEMIMTNTPAQGAAFPIEGYSNGISIRDYFATAAMQGWLASFPEQYQHPVSSGSADLVAEISYLMADAMLRAREAS